MATNTILEKALRGKLPEPLETLPSMTCAACWNCS
jgi:hypothetical protein